MPLIHPYATRFAGKSHYLAKRSRGKRLIVHENTYSHGSDLAIDRRRLSALPNRQEEETQQTKDIGQKLIDSISLWQRRRLCGRAGSRMECRV